MVKLRVDGYKLTEHATRQAVREELKALTHRKPPTAVCKYCLIHKQALAAKDLRPGLEKVPQTATKVRFVKSSEFARFCEEVSAGHTLVGVSH